MKSLLSAHDQKTNMWDIEALRFARIDNTARAIFIDSLLTSSITQESDNTDAAVSNYPKYTDIDPYTASIRGQDFSTIRSSDRRVTGVAEYSSAYLCRQHIESMSEHAYPSIQVATWLMRQATIAYVTASRGHPPVLLFLLPRKRGSRRDASARAEKSFYFRSAILTSPRDWRMCNRKVRSPAKEVVAKEKYRRSFKRYLPIHGYAINGPLARKKVRNAPTSTESPKLKPFRRLDIQRGFLVVSRSLLCPCFLIYRFLPIENTSYSRKKWGSFRVHSLWNKLIRL